MNGCDNASTIVKDVTAGTVPVYDVNGVKKKHSFKIPQCDVVIDNHSHKDFAPQVKERLSRL